MNSPICSLLLIGTLLQCGFAGPNSPTEPAPKPAAPCPSCVTGSSRLAADLGKPCPADCTKLCCTGKTAYFSVAQMTDAPAANKVTQALSSIDGTKIEKVCLKTPCAVVKYDPAKTNATKLAKVIDDTGAKVIAQKLSFQVSGMTCSGCSTKLTQDLTAATGLTKVEKVSHETGLAIVFIDPAKTSSEKIAEVIKTSGYSALPK